MTSEYLAGFFDGEGCIDSSQGKIRLKITQKDTPDSRSLFAQIQNEWGGCIYTDNRGISVLRWVGRKGQPILEAMLPHLRLKTTQAVLALQWMKKMDRTHSESKRTWKKRAACWLKAMKP